MSNSTDNPNARFNKGWPVPVLVFVYLLVALGLPPLRFALRSVEDALFYLDPSNYPGSSLLMEMYGSAILGGGPFYGLPWLVINLVAVVTIGTLLKWFIVACRQRRMPNP